MSLERTLSTERLARYRRWANDDEHQTLELYALNVAISEAFYTSLHLLEIGLRNAVHDGMTRQYGSAWFSNPAVLNDTFLNLKVGEAKARLPDNPTDGQVIAELMLGYWTALFGRRYNILWGTTLKNVFDAGYPLRRADVAGRLNRIRELRNRIAHHEPIIQRDLPAAHTEIRELIGWLSPDLLVWCDARCRFSAVHPPMPIIQGNLKNPDLTL